MPSLREINVARGERGLLVGETRTGKSTLANAFIDMWAQTDRSARILLVDSKPRFRAQYELSGWNAAHIYTHWRQGALVPYSYRLPVGATLNEQTWELARTTTPRERGLVVIAQVPVNSKDVRIYYPWLDQCIRRHYAALNKRHWNYFYIDEMLSLMRGTRKNQAGAVQVITAGGELGHTFLGGTQRPRWIPVEAMTELTRLYLFKLSGGEDLKHIKSMGLPPDFGAPDVRHQFNVYSKIEDITASLKLPESLAKKYGGLSPT